MRRIIVSLAFLLAFAGPAVQAKPLPVTNAEILTLSPEQQRTRYRAMEKAYQSEVVKRGPHVQPLPKASRQIAPAWTYDGKRWTVASYMKANRVSGLLVVKDGKILLERYGLGRRPTDRWTSFSVAKSVTSTLVGAAIQDGRIKGLDSFVTDYVPELKGSAYEGVTVRQMLTMSSGVKWNEDYADPNSDVARASTAIHEPGVDPLIAYMRRLPRAHPPGATFNYNTGETDLVGIMLAKAVGEPLSKYLSEKIWRPYGMGQDAIWMLDAAGYDRGGCCISMTLRDYARFGQFVLDGGRVGGQRVVPAGWTDQATRVEMANGQPPPAGYGFFWWVRSPDRYEAVGIFGQSITTFRKERLIVVQNAAWPKATGHELSAARNAMIEAVAKTADEGPQNGVPTPGR